MLCIHGPYMHFSACIHMEIGATGNLKGKSYLYVCYLYVWYRSLKKTSTTLISMVSNVNGYLWAWMGVNRIANWGPYLLLNNELELYFLTISE